MARSDQKNQDNPKCTSEIDIAGHQIKKFH